MNTISITALAYPPPPPPPPPPTPTKSGKNLAVALLLVLVIASALALGYMATGGFNLGTGNKASPSPSASPSGSATASPSALPTASSTSSSSSTPSHTPNPTTSATATPQPTSTEGNNQGYANFRNGAWANYTIKTYNEGTVFLETRVKESVDSGTYKGVACWLLTTAQDQTYGGYTSNTKTILYLQKSNLQGLHVKIYFNDVLTDEYDLNATATTDPGTTGEIDPNAIVSYETIIVPAGTFTNCAKAQVTSTSGNAFVWAHQDVPVFGLVKMEFYSGTTLNMTEELTAYGG